MTRLGAALAVCLAAVAPVAGRPNVVVVVTDDQGMGDFSFFGNPVLKTPNMDRLARESVRFTDFHVAPMCSPTRGQLLTGVDAVRNGVTSVSAGRTFLRPGIPTLPEAFAAAGYKTGLFGKWHLGDHAPHRPTDRGFHEAVYHRGWGMLFSLAEFDNPLSDGRCVHNGKDEPFRGHCTDKWFDAATAWMAERKAKGEPFLCYIPTNAPHAPHLDREEYTAPYRGKGPAPFFGMIAHVDDRLGRLDEFLRTSGLRDDTIMVFLTDNGGTAGVPVFNAGLRGHKTEYYEGGHRVPCWVRWPTGKLGAPRDVPGPTEVQDLFPTLLELCGVPAPAGCRFDGVSLATVLRDPTAKVPERTFVVQYGQTPKKGAACVVRGRWRLVNDRELYDVDADRGQAKDVSADHPDVVTELRAFYETWWAGAAGKLNEFVPVADLGSPAEPEVALTSADWEDMYVDNAGHLRTGAGGPTGGRWHVTVATAGTYEFVLRRWPKQTGAALGSKFEGTGPIAAIAGRTYPKPIVAFPIAQGVVEAAGAGVWAKTAPTEQEVAVRLPLPAGRTTVKAWFRDASGDDLCGAYFVDVKRAE